MEGVPDVQRRKQNSSLLWQHLDMYLNSAPQAATAKGHPKQQGHLPKKPWSSAEPFWHLRKWPHTCALSENKAASHANCEFLWWGFLFYSKVANSTYTFKCKWTARKCISASAFFTSRKRLAREDSPFYSLQERSIRRGDERFSLGNTE